MKTNLGCFKKQNQIKLKSIEKKIQKKTSATYSRSVLEKCGNPQKHWSNYTMIGNIRDGLQIVNRGGGWCV